MCIFRVDLGYFLHSHQHPLRAAITPASSPLPRAQPARSHSPSPNLQDSKLGNKRAAPPLASSAAIHKRQPKPRHAPLTGERPSRFPALSPSHATSERSAAEAMRCLAGGQLEAKRGFSFPAAQPHSGASCLYTRLFIAAGERPGTARPQSPSGSKKKKIIIIIK